MGNQPKRVADEDDVAQSATNSFFKAATNGRLGGVENRDDLWKVLLTITIRKVNRQKERAMAKKRGGGLADGESRFANGIPSSPGTLEGIPDDGFLDSLLLECRDLISELPNESLREIASPGRLCSRGDRGGTRSPRSTVKRKLARIRELWTETFDD